MEGRLPHALRFEIDGKVVFARLVHSPGMRAFAPMRSTLDEEATSIKEGFQQAAAEGAAS